MKKISRTFKLVLVIIIGFSSLGQAQKSPGQRIPVLAYHHILKKGQISLNGQEKNKSVLSLEEFQEQMKYLHDQGYYTASLEEVEGFLTAGLDLPKKTVVLSFDDGYLSNKIYAYPILKQYGQKANMFVITSLIHHKTYSFDPRKIQFLRWEDMKGIEDVFSFHSHTHDMHRGVGSGLPLLYTSPRQEVKRDLLQSRSLLNTHYLAYPSGVNSPLIIGELRDSGYSLAFTIAPGYLDRSSDPYRLPRFNMDPGPKSFQDFKAILNFKKL